MGRWRCFRTSRSLESETLSPCVVWPQAPLGEASCRQPVQATATAGGNEGFRVWQGLELSMLRLWASFR